VKKIIDQLNEFKVFRLGITGGEPLLYTELIEVLSYASSKQMIVTLNTNGYLMTDKFAKMLSLSGIDHIHVSIDGDKETHNFIRGNNKSYDRAVDAIKLLKKNKVKVEINYTVMKTNLHCFHYMMNLAQDLKVKINIKRFIPTGRGAFNLENVLSAPENSSLLKSVKEYADSLYSLDYCFLNSELHLGNCNLNNRSIISIKENGDIYTCPYLQIPDLKLGNIYEDSIKNIYTNKISNHELINFSAKNLCLECQECKNFEFCFGGCRAHALSMSGNL